MTSGEMHAPVVSALVVTYNRKKLLEESLAAIAAQSYPVVEIVVIDNASTDGTAELFSGDGSLAKCDLINYHRMDTNLGGAGGFKEGLRIASQSGADWVWLMDDDCIPYPDTLRNLVDAAEKARDRGIDPSFLASTVFGPQGEPMNVPVVDSRPTCNGYPDWYMGLEDGMIEIECATFVSLLINCTAVYNLGLPVGSFFIWGDDTEYTTRLTHNFGPAYLVGSSRVLHKRANAKSLNIMNEDDPKRIKNFRYLYRNNLIVQRFHYGRKAATRLALHDLKEALGCLVSGRGNSAIRYARSEAIITGMFEYLGGEYDLEDLGNLARRP
ncbi:MAG: glycosyltransferase family 2 protein [Tractidigestivibacter sp.]|jgi:GT2 family glycosyltransferase|uniref:glycosyltransferase family 2 protein n=1 Tax=Tractidigestivibacter sp. TaxID=2847320 RepID=UPI003D904BD4